jgi:hypothetical protein
LKETGQALIILMRTSKITYNPLNEGATASSISPCPTPLLNQSPLIALMASHS